MKTTPVILVTNKMGLLLKNLSMTQKEELSAILEVTPRTLYRFSENPLKISTERNHTIVRFLTQLYNREFDMNELLEPIVIQGAKKLATKRKPVKGDDPS